MRIAIVSDEAYPVNNYVINWLKDNGHEVKLFGALKTNKDESYVKATIEAAEAIVTDQADEGIFFCWTGTGTSIVANRFPTIRAALCADAETARAARIWNHANVLALSNRLLSQDIAKEILQTWFASYEKSTAAKHVEELEALKS